MKAAVIGLGSMGMGMARSLLRSPSSSEVVGCDLNPDLVASFRADAEAAGKAGKKAGGVAKAAPSDDVVLLVLVNEAQCESTCFGSGTEVGLLSILREGSCVIVSSTVSASWAKSASDRFAAKGIKFCDCPVSGGAARAASGELTIMASGSPEALECVDPLLRAMGSEVHVIPGGAGMGSTVKTVHQLLAGAHIVAAAEALALASKAGLDVEQVYDIVNGAAGASWMFRDRGRRMIDGADEVKSALAIFVKDLDIVHGEAKRLGCPVPLASAALQQFISGAGMGLERADDSQVVKVYETLAGTSVGKPPKGDEDDAAEDGDDVGDYWTFPDGTRERILEVSDEARHNIILSNEYARVMKVAFPPGDATHAHRHAEDSLYFYLMEGGLDVIIHEKGLDPTCDCLEFGEVRYGTHRSDKPLVHKITNTGSKHMFCVDAEVLTSPPVTSPFPLVAERHELIKTRDRCRVYKLALNPGESATTSYPFFHLTVVLRGSRIRTETGVSGGRPFWYEVNAEAGAVEWRSPIADAKVTNVGEGVYEQFVAEWR
ncbi:hypothetical protein ACHAWF_018118 [Thalassiosira exigua]